MVGLDSERLHLQCDRHACTKHHELCVHVSSVCIGCNYSSCQMAHIEGSEQYNFCK